MNTVLCEVDICGEVGFSRDRNLVANMLAKVDLNSGVVPSGDTPFSMRVTADDYSALCILESMGVLVVHQI